MAEATPKQTVRREIPIDEIREAIKNHPECRVKITRKNLRGNWAGVGIAVKQTEDLIEIDDWIRGVAGGGMFRVEARDVNDKTRLVVPVFEIELEGPELASKIAVAPSGGRPTSAGASGSGGASPPQRQWGPQVVMSDGEAAGIAQEHARDYRQDFLAEKEARERDRAQFNEKLEALGQQLSASEKRHNEQLQAAKERALEDKLEMLTKRLESGPQKPAFDPQVVATIVTGLAGVMTSVIESSKARAELQTQSLQSSVNSQLGLVKDLVVKGKGGEDGGMSKLLEVAMPLIQTMMEERSPSKIAELVGAQADSSATMLSMVSQFIDKFGPGEPENPGMELARKLVDTLTKSAEEMGQYTRRAVGGGRGLNGAGPQQLPPDATPQQIANAVYNAPGLPDAMRTADWHQIFFELHVGADPVGLARKIAQLLERTDPLPPPFTDMYDDDQNMPSAYLGQFLQQMPVWNDRQYVGAVLQAFDRSFEQTDDEPIVTPPPTPNAAPGPASFVQVEQPEVVPDAASPNAVDATPKPDTPAGGDEKSDAAPS